MVCLSDRSGFRTGAIIAQHSNQPDNHAGEQINRHSHDAQQDQKDDPVIRSRLFVQGVQPLHGRRKEIADAQRIHDGGEKVYRLAYGPENGADRESKAQVDALVAEEGCQRFGVGPHREPSADRDYSVSRVRPAGFLEEIGWMGYAFPKMRPQTNGLAPSILLGLLWALWHLPVIDYLGTATPHGAYWLPFFLAFGLAMTAMRVLIAWIYTNTKSVLLPQLMHVSSTGSLVIFSAAHVTALQEAMWYALYGTVLWFAVGIVVKIFGRRLGGHGG